ncbi:GTPase-associated system all-helical protein GASH [Massilia timonae]|uniref:GTPase-associated system all-helical protein GASH n=1 Tax=Massilia timonae TaxID=47229 RepID=UPI0023551370|nr:GTPase-associated system all-helical protein GASH [Massilia timonae]
MSIMAKYAQIIWAEPTNADVQERNKAVETLQAKFSVISTREAIALAAALADGFSGAALPEKLAGQVEQAISAESAAFVLKGKEVQAQVCLAVAVMVVVREAVIKGHGWTTADAFAASLWSALSLQEQCEQAHLEALRQDLIEVCRARVAHVAKAARKRLPVPDVGTLTIPEEDPASSKANTAYKKATAPVIAALKTNQGLDHEELNFLWWVIADYSEILGCALADSEPFTRAIASGLEGATMLYRLPSDGQRHAVLRHVAASQNMSLQALIGSLGEWRAKLRAPHADGWATTFPLVFPLISSLIDDAHQPKTAVELDARGWGGRALLEASILAMESQFAGAA